MSETRSSHVPTIVRGAQRHVLLPAMLLASSSVLLLSGCGSALNLGQGSAGPAEVAAMRGTVHGGQAPIMGSAITLYEIGATAAHAGGYAAALPNAGLPVLGTATTDSSGNWSIASPTACVDANDEIYLTAVGGEPVGTAQASNTALVMTSVGGPCGNQFTHSFDIDEVTTVATEYALSGFSSDYLHVGTSPTNGLGLTNAFATVTNLVNLGTGLANTKPPAYVTPPANSNADVFSAIVPIDTIYALADVLAPCVNAAAGAADPACTNLFSYTGGSNSTAVGTNGVQGPVAGNTADAILYIAHNPGLPANGGITISNVGNLLALQNPSAPFQPSLSASAPPSDLTMTINFVGGGMGGNKTGSSGNLSGATQITIDKSGNIWVQNQTHKTITELSNLGAPLSPTTQVSGTSTIAVGGFPLSGTLGTISGHIDTDQQGNVWVPDTTSCVHALSPAGVEFAGSPFTTVCPTAGARAAAADASNNVWISGTGPAFVTSISNPLATVRTGFPVIGGLSIPGFFLQPDESGNMWFTDQNNGDYVTQTGTLNVPYPSAFGGTAGTWAAFGIGGGNVSLGGSGLVWWVPQPSVEDIQTEQAIPPFNPANSFLPSTEFAEVEIWADGNNRFWFDNAGSTGVNVPANITEYLTNNTQVSLQNTGYTGGSELMAIDAPQGFSIDQSGNGWLLQSTNFNALNKSGPYGSQYLGNGVNAANITEFVGLAAPTQPVQSFSALNATYGVKP
ncbi:MAG: hypothetical protein WBQ94_30940 [Terracidiphilus sp.]